MKEPLISVLVLTYHPDKDALFSTLRSVVNQKDCDFELIVTDDGSPDFFEQEIRDFLDSWGGRYQILSHAQNRGTVKNLLDAVRSAHGKYIKPISPGDYLYDDTTLRDVAVFMDRNSAAAVFGKMMFYTYDPDLRVKNLVFPYFDGIYRAAPYSSHKAVKYQMVFSDFICGASAFYQANALEVALETIAPAVRYIEDAVFQLFALQGVRIYGIDRLVVWYEHGSGISTKKTGQDFTRIDEDFYNFYRLMAEKFPENRSAQRAFRIWELRKNSTKATQTLHKLRPDKILFSLRIRLRKKKLKIADYDDKFFRQCQIDGK